jgi:protein dithiol:quinone oxidoreductase
MLRFLNRSSRGRSAWLLLAFGALALELMALYFQHVMHLYPCVLCIYERTALFGVMAAGVLGAMAPATSFRYLAILLWIYSSWAGLKLAWQHTMMQLHPSPFYTCDLFVSFPSWLPLDSWFPAIFQASGDCSAKQWSFLTLEMPQWLVGIFAFYLIAGLLVLISQPFKPRRRDLFGR